MQSSIQRFGGEGETSTNAISSTVTTTDPLNEMNSMTDDDRAIIVPPFPKDA
jgi:hypothetical protein